MKEDKRQQKKSWASAQQDVYLELLIVGGVLCTACLLKFSIIFPLFNSLKHSREACLFACFIGCQISPLLPSSVNICKGSKFLTKSTQKKKKESCRRNNLYPKFLCFFLGFFLRCVDGAVLLMLAPTWESKATWKTYFVGNRKEL